MKKRLLKYRSVGIIAGSLIFNLITSLLVYHPEGVAFNIEPLTIEEWVCDIISIVVFFFGLLMMMYDSNRNFRKEIEKAFEYGAEELKKTNVEMTFK